MPVIALVRAVFSCPKAGRLNRSPWCQQEQALTVADIWCRTCMKSDADTMPGTVAVSASQSGAEAIPCSTDASHLATRVFLPCITLGNVADCLSEQANSRHCPKMLPSAVHRWLQHATEPAMQNWSRAFTCAMLVCYA